MLCACVQEVFHRGNLFRVKGLFSLQLLMSDALKRVGLQVFGLGLAELDAAHDREWLARPHFLSELRNNSDHSCRYLAGNFAARTGVGLDDGCGVTPGCPGFATDLWQPPF